MKRKMAHRALVVISVSWCFYSVLHLLNVNVHKKSKCVKCINEIFAGI